MSQVETITDAMPVVYKQFDAAFRNVAAFVITHNGKMVAKVAFKATASGNVHAFVHYHGERMVRGVAKGGGYDKRTYACELAAQAFLAIPRDANDVGEAQGTRYMFFGTLAHNSSDHWDHALRAAGFDVLGAV